MTTVPDRIRRICVLTGDHRLPDATKPDSEYGELDLAYHRAMQAAVRSLPGLVCDFVSEHQGLLSRWLENPPEFVLNLCDTGFQNVATRELHIPALLELLGVPYSGATPAGMVQCYDKQLVRLAADSLGMATPREMYLRHNEVTVMLESFEYPALIKPNRSDGSVGITKDSVVESAVAARAYIERLRIELPGHDVLVQEYLPGPEYGLALIGNPEFGFVDLPLLAIDYSELPGELPPILGYESKTDPTSPYWSGSRIVPADLQTDVVDKLRSQARRLFERLQCQDYARFDLRTRRDGEIALMEVNPNPAWDPEAKLAHMVRFDGRDYAHVFALILDAAAARIGKPIGSSVN